ncbi:ACT domain-containing protein acr10 [Ranunculus cassubicifolius]
MGLLSEDVVVINRSENPADPSVITINCPDKTGLGCDLCRILLFFGLSIVRGDVLTDGKWCYLVFWVIGKPTTRWSLLKKRLISACPLCASFSEIYNFKDLETPKTPDIFLLKFSGVDRKGLLHDTIEVLCELELIIRKVKVSTTPDGNVVDLFFVIDTRELLHTKERQEDTQEHLKAYLGDSMISCDIEMVGSEIPTCSQGASFLPPAITGDIFSLELADEHSDVSVTSDNSLSPSHTLVQIMCQDHKGLLYDIMRTLKDYNIQISYGRFFMKERGKCEVDLFLMQADGKKIVDPNKQNSLCSRLRMELVRPLRVATISRGPDTELLVANPVELSGKGRPLVIYDITLALKKLNTCIFSAEIGRHAIGGREWEVYRIRLEDSGRLSLPRNKIEGEVCKALMGWDLNLNAIPTSYTCMFSSSVQHS